MIFKYRNKQSSVLGSLLLSMVVVMFTPSASASLIEYSFTSSGTDGSVGVGAFIIDDTVAPVDTGMYITPTAAGLVDFSWVVNGGIGNFKFDYSDLTNIGWSTLVNGFADAFSFSGRDTETGYVVDALKAVDAHSTLSEMFGITHSITNPTLVESVPEPSTIAILALGLGLLGFSQRCKVLATNLSGTAGISLR